MPPASSPSSRCWTRSPPSAPPPPSASSPPSSASCSAIGVDAFFGYGEQQDFKDATKQIAFIQQGGLGLPEKDYYLRTGDKDAQIRDPIRRPRRQDAHPRRQHARAGQD